MPNPNDPNEYEMRFQSIPTDVRMRSGLVAVGLGEMAYVYDTGNGPASYPKIGGVPKAVVVTMLRTLANEIEEAE